MVPSDVLTFLVQPDRTCEADKLSHIFVLANLCMTSLHLTLPVLKPDMLGLPWIFKFFMNITFIQIPTYWSQIWGCKVEEWPMSTAFLSQVCQKKLFTVYNVDNGRVKVNSWTQLSNEATNNWHNMTIKTATPGPLPIVNCNIHDTNVKIALKMQIIIIIHFFCFYFVNGYNYIHSLCLP